jgi:choline dehydrogenase-like flavoprotein
VLTGDRVFLAAGAVSSLRIVIDSLQLHDSPLELQFQPYFLLPAALLSACADVAGERLHTLAQLFLDLVDDRLSPYTVHLQLYTYNDLVGERLDELARWMGPFRAFAARSAARRIVVLQGYLHSRDGSAIRVTAVPAEGRGARLNLRAGEGRRMRTTVGRVLRRLLRLSPATGIVPLPFALQMGLPGEGNHVGGVFPMGDRRHSFSTDRRGTLRELPRVHLVDSSVMPTLPATTLTYTLMANAHRIATEVARSEADTEPLAR